MGPALRTERELSRRATLGGLCVDGGGSFEEAEIFLANEDTRAKWAAREGLAVGAMADSDATRVDLGLESNLPTMTLAVNMHSSLPLPR